LRSTKAAQRNRGDLPATAHPVERDEVGDRSAQLAEIVTGCGRLVVDWHHSSRVEIGALWRSQRTMRAAGDHEPELGVIRRSEHGAEARAVVAAGTAHRAAF
jgi:hypothetical protein